MDPSEVIPSLVGNTGSRPSVENNALVLPTYLGSDLFGRQVTVHTIGALDRGIQCHMSIFRNFLRLITSGPNFATLVALLNILNDHVTDFKLSCSCHYPFKTHVACHSRKRRPVDFRGLAPHYSVLNGFRDSGELMIGIAI